MAAPFSNGAAGAGLAAAERAANEEGPTVASGRAFGDRVSGNAGDCAARTAAGKRDLFALSLNEAEAGACLLIGEARRRCEPATMHAAGALLYLVQHSPGSSATSLYR